MTQCNNYIDVDGTYYVLDMNALSAYLIGNDNEKIIEKTKSEQWMVPEDASDNELNLVSKDITETSSARKDTYAPFRAEIVKMMLILVLYPTVDENGEAKEIKSLNDPLSMGQIISFNTLIAEGIIKELQVEDNNEENE